MFLFFLKRLFLLIYSIIVCMLFLIVQVPLPTYAYTITPLAAQVTLTGTTIGHPGTKIHITGSGFTPASTVNLYTTTTPDPAQCVASTDPAAAGLTPFSSSPIVTIQADGSFNVDTTWPDNAATATTVYYICAISPSSTALSSNTFTVAQAVTIDSLSPANVAPGGTVTIAGSNWLPVQALDVSLVTGAAAIAENNNVMPDANGHFSVTLTTPSDVQLGSYALRVYAVNEQTMTLQQNQALTVTQTATPTPTPTTAPSPTSTPTSSLTATPTVAPTVAPTQVPTPAPTPTPASSNTNTTSNNPTTSYVIVALGSLGVLLVVIGTIMFFVYSRSG